MKALFLPVSVALSLAAGIYESTRCHAFASSLPASSSFLPPYDDEDAAIDRYSFRDSWSLIVLGDLHMEDDMTAHVQARDDCLEAVKELSLLPSSTVVGRNRTDGTSTTTPRHEVPLAKELVQDIQNTKASELTVSQLELLLAKKRGGDLMQCHLVSLGDLGRKQIRHEPGDSGTTKSFRDAKDFLDGFGVPYEIVTGNHDLEGLDEFDTDKGNLQAWLDCFEKDTPQFCRQIGERTLLLGLSTVRFRDSPYSSHEVHIDNAQLDWFVQMVETHPVSEGWKILVVSHAPIIGSGLRVLQHVHVTNGCAWLNHCSDNRSAFIQCVRKHPQIKLWFSGHFHLSHDFEDSISTVGSCTFVQVGVIGPASARDDCRQTRIVQGSKDRFKIISVNHHDRDVNGKANLRLDVDIDLVTGSIRHTKSARDHNHENWFRAYSPRDDVNCYISSPHGSVLEDARPSCAKARWWRMKDDRVIGMHDGQLVEYDRDTLAPLGIVVDRSTLGDRGVAVVGDGTVLILIDQATKDVEVVHPNQDGSYWRKYQRNKRVREAEKAREDIARRWLEHGKE